MRLFTVRARLCACVALFATIALPARAADWPCFAQDAIQSARIHDLQVMLMVNALKCRTRQPETLRSYGDLLDQRGSEFGEHGRLLENALVMRYGLSQGQAAFHSYETAIANYHSIVEPSLRQCDQITTYIDLAGRADHAELETLSRLTTGRAIDACLVPLHAVASAAEVPSAVPIEAAPQVVDGIPTYPVPGTGPDTKPEPLERVAVLEPAVAVPAPAAPAAPATPSASQDKLDQAIVALSAAVAALSELRQQP